MLYHDLFIEKQLPPVLDYEELCSYFSKMSAGEKSARTTIIVSNIRLVFKEVMHKFVNVPYDKNELISVGLIGLIQSVDNFDINKDIKFSTYAIKCIDNEIFKFLKRNNKYLDNISLDETTDKPPIFIPANEEIDFNIENSEIYDSIKKVISTLSVRDREIVKRYFGLFGYKSMTEKDIANYLNLSHYNVSRIIRNFLNKLKRNLRIQDDITIREYKLIKHLDNGR